MNQNLESIVELQDAITRLKEAEERLRGIPDWMRELHEEHVARKAEIETVEAAAETAARERRQAEGAITDAQEKLKKYQQQINKVSTQREYGALLQEIDTVKGQISGLEEAAFSALERNEKAQKDLASLRESFQDVEQRYNTELARWEEEKPGVARQVADLQERIAGIRQRVPRPVLGVFERVLLRYPAGALAPVRPMDRPAGKGQREWHCTACNYRVRPQTVVEIQNTDNLVQCDSCKRILFIEAGQPE